MPVPGSPEWVERVQNLVKEEEERNDPHHWYLSYADEDGWKGAIIILAYGFSSAAVSARVLGISPGGQVCGHPIPDDKVPPESFQNRLLNREELESIAGPLVKMSELEAEEADGRTEQT